MTLREAQLRLVGVMNKLTPAKDSVHVPSSKGVEDDFDYLDILVSHTLLDMEAKIREARAQNG